MCDYQIRLTAISPSPGFRRIRVNEEIPKGVIEGNAIRFDPGDSGCRRSRPKPFNEPVDSLTTSLGEHLDRSIGTVSDPAAETIRSRHLSAALPEADSLNSTRHGCPNRTLTHWIL